MEEQILSRYSIQKYIDKKWKDISKDIPTVKAYNLGLAVGYFQAYKNAKISLGEETMKEIWSGLSADDDFTKTLRTLIELDNKENTSTAEKIAEMLENCRKTDEELSDDDRDLLEDFMEFLNQKQKQNGDFLDEKRGEIIVVVAEIWRKLGYTEEQSEELEMLSTINNDDIKNIDSDTATKTLLETMKKYQLDKDEVKRIIEKFNKIANQEEANG